MQSWCIVVVQLCRLCRIVGVFGSGWRGIFLVVLLWGLFGGLRWCRRLLTFLVLLCGLWRGTGSANLLGLLCGKNSGSSLVFGLPRGGLFLCPVALFDLCCPSLSSLPPRVRDQPRVPTRCPALPLVFCPLLWRKPLRQPALAPKSPTLPKLPLTTRYPTLSPRMPVAPDLVPRVAHVTPNPPTPQTPATPNPNPHPPTPHKCR